MACPAVWACRWKVFKHVWADTVSSPADQVANTLYWCVSVHYHHSVPYSVKRTAQPPTGTKHIATCWADVRKPPGGSLCCWNNTLHINTWPCGEDKKKNCDHVLRSMPMSRPTEWKGQLGDKEAEEVKAPTFFFFLKCWSFSSILLCLLDRPLGHLMRMQTLRLCDTGRQTTVVHLCVVSVITWLMLTLSHELS